MKMRFIIPLWVLALLEFVTSAKLRTLGVKYRDVGELKCFYYGRSVACLLPGGKDKRMRQVSPRVSDDYIDWLDMRSNVKGSFQKNVTNRRRNIYTETSTGDVVYAPLIGRAHDLDIYAPISKGRALDGFEPEKIKQRAVGQARLAGFKSNINEPMKYIANVPKYVVPEKVNHVLLNRQHELDGFESENTPTKITDKLRDTQANVAEKSGDSVGPKINHSTLFINRAHEADSEAENDSENALANTESEDYIVPKKVNRQYKNNVIDVYKYIRPRIVYMQGPSRVVPAGARRGRFLPKRYHYYDISNLNTFWNNGYRYKI